MNKRHLVCSVLFFAIGFTSSAFAEKRVALVIGNSTYQNVTRLDNPSKDASLIADTLKGIGFTLVGGGAQVNLDKAALDNAVQSFGKQIQGADVAVFYYAGHGVQVRGSNYLVPVNANPTRESDVDFQMTDVNLVMNQMQGSGTRLNLVILDACRNNPFGGAGLRSTGGGLAQISAPEGTMISYATQPGNVAQDGDDGHSPYTKALAATMLRSGLDIFQTFNQIGLAVKRSTAGSQQPWVSSSPIDGTFYFTAPAGAAPGQQQTQSTDSSKSQDVTDCDRLASNPTDQKHTTGIPGVKIYQIDIATALAACNAAMSKFPDVPRFSYQAGRIATAQKDYVRARQLYERSAAAGYSASMVSLGNTYLYGRSVTVDKVEARRWYEKAASLSDPAGFEGIGQLAETGPPPDYVEAARWYRKAADAGLGVAMSDLAKLYRDGGFGLAKDFTESRKWYEKSAATGEPGGITGLGFLYDKGKGVAVDHVEAVKFYKRAIALGEPDAMNALGNLLVNGVDVPQDFTEARRLFEKAAAVGIGNAMIGLGNLYRDGKGVPQDFVQARAWYEKATATAGNNSGPLMVGLLFYNGQGVGQDFNQARQFFEQAAAAGNLFAMTSIGNFYRDGTSVPQDYAQARSWYEKAAAGGFATAMINLGNLYENGLGVTKDTAQARKLYQMATAAGDAGAQAALDRLNSSK